jgi:Zn-dependent metalloprotease
MRRKVWLFLGLVAMVCAPGAMADPAEPTDLFSVYRSFQPTALNQSLTTGVTDDGYFSFIMSPDDSAFVTDSATKSTDPSATAAAFVSKHGPAFGVKSTRSGFAEDRTSAKDGRSYVRMNQTYDGLPVYGAQVNVSLDADGNVSSVLSDVMRETSAIDQDNNFTTPTLDTDEARVNAMESVQSALGESDYLTSEPQLIVYDPGVLGQFGEPRLAYKTIVLDESDATVEHSVITDAHSGNSLLDFALLCTALAREIYDGRGLPGPESLEWPGILVREEGGAEVGDEVPNADFVYDVLGATYDYYDENHDRDSVDDNGLKLRASVGIDDRNAFYMPITGDEALDAELRELGFVDMMAFGADFVSDDIVAHEVTHGVTAYTSNLIYAFESGAINESLSDIWGEFVDLGFDGTNTGGGGGGGRTKQDDPEDRWLVGEDSAIGAIRSMSDPRGFGNDPDRYSEIYRFPITLDNGGVHRNSGIGNKLCYLLTDGDTFNEQIVEGVGEAKVVELFYQAQTMHLTEASGYFDLYFALLASAKELGWSDDELRTLFRAGSAVEIVQPAEGKALRQFRLQSRTGVDSLVLSWLNPDAALSDIVVTRNADGFPVDETDGDVLQLTNAERANGIFEDTGLVNGQEYFYRLTAEFDYIFLNQSLPNHRRGVAGDDSPDFLTEEFLAGTSDVDLSFSQLMFSPVGDSAGILASKSPPDYASHLDYTAVLTENVFELPVAPTNAIPLTFAGNGTVRIAWPVLQDFIPYFGHMVSEIIISANGSIIMNTPGVDQVLSDDTDIQFPTLESHWVVPRISFLFGNLALSSGGAAWARSLDDRFVVTFERASEFGVFPPQGSTVQVEMFYSGHIRMTFLELNNNHAIIGLSDGKGVPVDVEASLAQTLRIPANSDLSSFASSVALTLDPIPIQRTSEGGFVSFQAQANPFGDGEVDWNADGEVLSRGAKFDEDGLFSWQTSSESAGFYALEVSVEQNGQIARQRVLIIVDDVTQLPSYESALLTPELPVEGESLLVTPFGYSHPEGIAEGIPEILWFRNGFFVQALTNQRIATGRAMVAGDVWWAVMIPRTASGLRGEAVFSQNVTIGEATEPDINGDEKLDSTDVQLVINGALSKNLGVLNGDVNRDGGIDSVDVQIVMNGVLGR